MRRQRDGFTLVELLVVMAIISVLAAFLLPALENAMESARRAYCANNMRQLSVADMNYMSDYEEWVPVIGHFYGSAYPTMGKYYNSGVDLPPYFFDIWPDGIRWCPSVQAECDPCSPYAGSETYSSLADPPPSTKKHYGPATKGNPYGAFGYYRPGMSNHVSAWMNNRTVDCFSNSFSGLPLNGLKRNFIRPLRKGWAHNIAFDSATYTTSFGNEGEVSVYQGRMFDPVGTLPMACDISVIGAWGNNWSAHGAMPVWYEGGWRNFEGQNTLWEDGSVQWKFYIPESSARYVFDTWAGKNPECWSRFNVGEGPSVWYYFYYTKNARIKMVP